MKNKRNLGVGIVLVVVLAALFTSAIYAGYKVVTYLNKDVDDQFRAVGQLVEDKAKDYCGIDLSQIKETFEGPPYVYKKQGTRNYDGPRIYESYGYIYNDQGKVLTDFYEKDGYGLYISFNADRSEAVFNINGKCYYINGDLEYTLVSDDCSDSCINYEGGYIAYNSGAELRLYEIATGEETVLARTGFNSCISPNGKTVSYYSFSGTNAQVYVGGISVKTHAVSSSSSGYYTPTAVSDDGKVVYYELSNDKTRDGFYCSDDGVEKKIASGYLRGAHFTRDCKQALVSTSKHVSYYRPGMDKAENLSIFGILRDLEFFGVSAGVNRQMVFEPMYILDTDCFSDVSMVTTGEKTYCLQGDVIPSEVLLRNEGANSHDTFTSEGPISIYLTEGEAKKVRILDGKAVREDYFTWENGKIKQIFTSDDFSECVFIAMEKNEQNADIYNLYYYHEGKKPVFIAETTYNSNIMVKWDQLTEKWYYISQNTLYSADRRFKEKTVVCDSCDHFDFRNYGDQAMVFADTDGKLHVLINDMILDLE